MNKELLAMKKDLESKKLEIQTHLKPFTDEIARLEIELGNKLYHPLKDGFKALIDIVEARFIPIIIGTLLESRRFPLQGDEEYVKDFNDAFNALREILQECNDRMIEPKDNVETKSEDASKEESSEQINK